MRAIRKIVMIGAAVVAVSSLGVNVALADPPSTPALKSIVGVGSDTITPLFDKVTTDYNTGHSFKMWSWDAVNPTTGAVGDTIVTKASSSSDTTCQMARPDGSSAGITALENTATDGGYPCIDYARSSRAPATTDPNTIVFDEIARDAITWASPKGVSGTPSPVPATLSVKQLANIYNCTAGFTKWSEVGGSSSATIVPVLPQSGSGTRSTFLLAMGQALGLGSGVSLTPGPCVVNGTDSDGAIEENTGVTAPNQEVFGTPTAPLVDALYPYAISADIAQTVDGHATSIWKPAELGMHEINGIKATSGTGTSTVINPKFPTAMWRTIYIVVPNAGTESAPAIPTTPINLNTPFSATGWLCTSTKAQADLLSYGFTSLGSACGTLTDEFLTYG